MLLNYLKSLTPVKDLSLKALTFKAVDFTGNPILAKEMPNLSRFGHSLHHAGCMIHDFGKIKTNQTWQGFALAGVSRLSNGYLPFCCCCCKRTHRTYQILRANITKYIYHFAKPVKTTTTMTLLTRTFTVLQFYSFIEI